MNVDLDLIRGVAETLHINPASLVLGILGTAAALVAGVAAKVCWKVAKWSAIGWYRGAKSAYAWWTRKPEPSDVCQAVLMALESRAVAVTNEQIRVENAHNSGYRIVDCRCLTCPGMVVSFFDDGKLASVRTGARNLEVLDHLKPWEEKMVKAKAAAVISRIAAENRDYDRMEIIDSLDSHVRASSGPNCLGSNVKGA